MRVRGFVAVCSWILLAAALVAFQPPAGQTEFVPIGQLPPGDQLPAARLLIAAYAFVWIALMAYLWSIWRRIEKVEAELRALDKRTAERSRSR